MANQINFQLTTSADLKGVQQLKKELQEVRNLANKGYSGESILAGEPEKIQQALKAANDLEYAMQAAFNPKINTIDIQKFNDILRKSGTDIKQLSNTLISLGPEGQRAFLTMNNSLMKMGTAVKQTNKFLNEMVITFKNSVKWGLSSAIWNNMIGGAEQAYGYVKNLDSSLNDIRIVTGKNADEMERFAKSANNAAKELGVATTDYTQGSTIYYQQGLDDETTETLTDITAKASNVTGQSMEQISEQLTAVWNGYQVANEVAEKGMGVYEEYVDKMAAVGAATASDLEELATAMSKVASSASMMGVDFDQLNAQIATIVSVTRQAPESVGTALKTIYARMGDLKLGGKDEDGIGLGDVSGQMEAMGIQVLDASGNLREMGQIIEDVAAKWSTWTEAERTAMAEVMAGKRQYNNLMALFNNWDMYSDTLEVARNATGTLQEQQDIYLESTKAKLEQLRATSEDLYDSLLDTDSINGIIEGVTTVVGVMADFADALGGLNNIIPLLGSVGLKVFKDQIGESIASSIQNSKNLNEQLEVQKKNQEEILKVQALKTNSGEMNSLAQMSNDKNTELFEQMKELNIQLTEEQIEQYNALLDINSECGKMAIAYEEQFDSLEGTKELLNQINNIQNEEIGTEEKNKKIKEEINAEINNRLDKVKQLKELSNQISEAENPAYRNTKSAINGIKEGSLNKSSVTQEYSDKAKDSITRTKGLRDAEFSMLNVDNMQQLEIYATSISDRIDNLAKNEILSTQEAEKLHEHFTHIYSTMEDVLSNTEMFSSELKNAGVENVEEISKKFKELSLEGKNASEIIEIIQQEFAEEIKENNAATEVLSNYKIKLEEATNANENFSESLKLENVVADITDTVGAMGELFSAWSMIQNLGSIWSDDDLTTTEKLEQTFMNLAIAIPSLITALQTLQGVQIKETAAKVADTTANLLNAASEKIRAAAKKEGAVAAGENTAAQITETTADTADAVGNLTNATSEGASSFAKLGNSAKNFLGSLKSGPGIIKNLVSGIRTLINSFGGWLLAIVLVGKALKAWFGKGGTLEKIKNDGYSLAEIAEGAKSSAQELKAQADEAEETAIKMRQLSEEYENLKEQQSSMGHEEYRNSLIKLCEQYGLEDQIIKILAGDYEGLEEAIKGAKEASEQEEYESAVRASNAQGNALRAGLNSAAKQSQNDGAYYDVHSGSGAMDDSLVNVLKNYGVDLSPENKKINKNSLIEALQKYGDELVSAISELDSKDAEELSDLLASVNEEITTAQELYNKTVENGFDALVSKYNLNEEEDFQSFSNNLDTAAQEAVDNGIADSIEKAKSKIYAAMDESSSQLAKSELKDLLVEQYGEGTKEGIKKALAGLSDEEILNVSTNFDLYKDVITDYEELINLTKDVNTGVANSLKNSKDSVVDIMSSLEDASELSEEQLGTLSEDTNFKNFLDEKGLNYGDFSALDFDDQIPLIQSYYDYIERRQQEFHQQIENELGILQNKTGTTKEQIEQETIDEGLVTKTESGRYKADYFGEGGLYNNVIFEDIEGAGEAAKQSLDKVQQIIQDEFASSDGVYTYDKNGELAMHYTFEGDFESAEDAAQKFIDYLGGNFEDLNDHQKEIFEDITYNSKTLNDLEINGNVLKSWVKLKNNVGRYSKVEESAGKASAALTNATEDMAVTYEDLNGQMISAKAGLKANINGLKEIQSTYSSLTSVVESYNSTGILTIDNLDTLLSMSPEMLACLEFENGQMSVNTNTMQQMALAKLDVAEAELYEEYTAKLNMVAMKETADAEEYAALEAEYFGNKAIEAGNKANNAVPLINNYKNALAGAMNVDSGLASAIDDDFQRRLSLIDAARNSISTNFSAAMGGSRSSGGSSGSKKEKEVKELDDSVADSYKQLERALETVNNQLSLLQERQEHLSGKALIKNIEKQTAAYVKQAAILERLNKTAAVDVATLRSQGSKYSNISYDTDGNITQESYEAEFAAQQAAYNAAVQRYNASAQTDADKAALKAAEESWQNFQDWIDNYDEAISKVEDYLNQLQEVIQSVADSNLSKFDVTFDVKLNTEELNREWAEFQRTYRRDFRRTERATAQDIRDLTESATSFQNSFNIEGNRFNDIINQADIMADVFSTYTDGLGNVSSDNVAELTEELRRQGVQYTTIADLQTDLQESFSSLQEYAEEVFNALQEGWDSYLQSLDDIDNKMNDLLSTYDKLASKNEYYLRIAELTAGVYDRTTSAADQLTAAQRQYYETTINNSESNLRALKSQKETYQEILNAIVAKYKAEGKTQEEIEQMEDYQKAADMLESIQDQYQDTVISALEAAKALEEIQRQEAYTLLEDALVGIDSEGNKYKDLAAEREAWEDALSYQERYYDTTQRLYQLDAIANKYTDAMNKDGISLKNQEKLNKMKQQELEILTKKEKLTKDDIALAEQRYNIAMAEIALEEARNNKNTMKVVRNEEGNWSYQYVADEENVADKEQALKDEYNELYELAKQAYQNSIQLALETKQEYLDKYKEIIEDEKLSEEEKQAAIALLNETYADRLKDYYDEAGQYMVDVNAASAQLITTIYQNELDGYSLMTEEQIGIAQAMEDAKLDSYYETRDLMAQGDNEYFDALQEYNSNSIAGWQDQAIQAQIANQAITNDSLTAYDMISDAAEQYRDTCDDVSDIVEEDWENLGEAMRDTEDDAQTAEDAVVDFGEEAQTQIRDQIEALQELQEIWNEVQSAIEQCRSALEQMMQAAESGIQSVAQAAASARSAANAATSTASSSGSGSRGGSGGGSGNTKPKGSIKSLALWGDHENWGYYDANGRLVATKPLPANWSRDRVAQEFRRMGYSLKSGGYTGEWSNGSNEENGRLAFLHQKELVLNENDTANFLDAVNTVRDLAHLSSSVNDVIMNSIAGLLYKMINSSPSNQVYNNNTDNSVMSPVFHINAEFPNATDKDSIMDAFISLPNIASQKVNMKLK